MELPFSKLHGCGNDYVYLDGFRDALPRESTWSDLARRISDRHTGVGSDGLIVVRPPATRSTDSDAEMVMFNADGSTSEMCGNGIRCAAKLVHDRQHVRSLTPRWLTGAGVRTLNLHVEQRRCVAATVRMGQPRLTPEAVPVVLSAPGPLLRATAQVGEQALELICVGMGNPHAVCFVDDPERTAVTTFGPVIEHLPMFPRRTNIEFVSVHGERIHQRTWERGSGETLACGTGACAATVAAILTGRLPSRRATVHLRGGDLRIAWEHDQAEVEMTGEAVHVFDGVWPL